jgi:hypothetical protein
MGFRVCHEGKPGSGFPVLPSASTQRWSIAHAKVKRPLGAGIGSPHSLALSIQSVAPELNGFLGAPENGLLCCPVPFMGFAGPRLSNSEHNSWKRIDASDAPPKPS